MPGSGNSSRKVATSVADHISQAHVFQLSQERINQQSQLDRRSRLELGDSAETQRLETYAQDSIQGNAWSMAQQTSVLYAF